MKKIKAKKKISMIEYEKKMAKIINKKLPVQDTLVLMLSEARKYEIKESNKNDRKI